MLDIQRLSRRGWLLSLALMAWLALGCGTVTGLLRQGAEVKSTVEALATTVGPTVEALATEVPAAQPAAGETPAATAEAIPAPEAVYEADAVRSLELRWQYRLHFTDTGEDLVLTEISWALDRDKPAEHVRLQGALFGQPIEWIQVGEQVWTKTGDSWMMVDQQSLNTRPEDLLGSPALPEAWYDESRQEVLETETVAGFPTTHIRWSATSTEALGYDQYVQGMTLGEYVVTRSNGAPTVDEWVSQEGWLLKQEIRMPVIVKGPDGQERPAEVLWEYDVLSLNQPLNIEAPQVDLRAPVPLPEGAQLRMADTGAGMWSYALPNTDLAGLRAFFAQQAAQGALTLQNEMGGPEMGFWQATVQLPDGSAWNVMASPEGQGVLLLIQKP